MSKLAQRMISQSLRQSSADAQRTYAQPADRKQAAELVLCPACGVNLVEPGYVCQACSDEVKR
jgi:hypothetical protein